MNAPRARLCEVHNSDLIFAQFEPGDLVAVHLVGPVGEAQHAHTLDLLDDQIEQLARTPMLVTLLSKFTPKCPYLVHGPGRGRTPDRESQVRSGLAGGVSGIRTLGPRLRWRSMQLAARDATDAAVAKPRTPIVRVDELG